MGAGVFDKAARATKSGLRRYPRELWRSLVERRRGPQPCVSGGAVDPASWEACRFGAAWIGHATVLLRVGERTVLTDPVFSHRIGMRLGGVTFGLSRLAPPGMDIECLPSIDLILLSHAHFDHLDRPSLERLASLHPGATVVTAKHTAGLVPEGFERVVEAQWDREVEVDGVRLHAIRPAHWGARTAVDRHRGFNAYFIERGGSRVLFAGDTAHTRAFDRVGRHDLSIFGIGAYEPWDGAHASPEQAWDMFRRAGGRWLLPMHHSTFDLGEATPAEPMQRLEVAAGGELGRVVCRDTGEVWSGGVPVE